MMALRVFGAGIVGACVVLYKMWGAPHNPQDPQIANIAASHIQTAPNASTAIASDRVRQESEDRYTKYLALLAQYAWPKGSWENGEIEIIDDVQAIPQIEAQRYQQLCSKGLPMEEAWNSSRVGIVTEDMYTILVRDAVKFPNGRTGTFFRYIWKSPDHQASGAAVLPITSDGRVVLILKYRHATRSWEFELPRGAKERGETMEQAIRRRLQEETGWVAGACEELGRLTVNTSAEGQRVPVYIAKLDHLESAKEVEGAIQGVYYFTKEEVLEGLKVGYLKVEDKQHPFCGAFEAYALLQAMLRQAI
ncbi:MAG: NUDIX hydrolase [Chlamydiia bacterium]|nr:NUDIX hydrolase [Chlamydiia bacterium]